MNRIDTYRSVVRPTLALVAGALFIYLSVEGLLPKEATIAIISVVFTFYFQSRMSDKIMDNMLKRIAHLEGRSTSA